MRRPLVAANWKMHFRRAEAESWTDAFLRERVESPAWSGVEVVLFASYPLLFPLHEKLASTPVALGAQDLSDEVRGAYTGEVSAEQLLDAGCRWVLVGHSERRQRHGEDNARVARKVARALDAGLAPLVCVGETLEERESGRTRQVLARQLEALPCHPSLAIAYEPVWAIGTGRSATPEIAAEAHEYLRHELERRWSRAACEGLRIVYGGSVTPANAIGLARTPGIDGALVGGASLEVGRFLDILRAFSGVPAGAPHVREVPS